MTDWRALCAELLDEVAARPLLLDRELLDRGRAALAAEPQGEGAMGRPAPPPADGEVRELVEGLGRICFDVAPCDADTITRAADLLTRLALQPVPVSERLPGPEDCDAKGQVWQWDGPSDAWVLYTSNGMSIRHAQELVDWWLPAHDLPLPSEVQP